jgi:hypothetical protein
MKSRVSLSLSFFARQALCHLSHSLRVSTSQRLYRTRDPEVAKYMDKETQRWREGHTFSLG